MKTKLKDVEDIKANLESMEWDELANNLIDLEIELEKTRSKLTKEQVNTFNLLILLYEKEKSSRITVNFDHNRFLEEEQFIAYDWTEDILDG
jgi:hypothetical protein